MHHHLPVVDAERRLVGIVTQSDLIGALCDPRPDAGEPAYDILKKLTAVKLNS